MKRDHDAAFADADADADADVDTSSVAATAEAKRVRTLDDDAATVAPAAAPLAAARYLAPSVVHAVRERGMGVDLLSMRDVLQFGRDRVAEAEPDTPVLPAGASDEATAAAAAAAAAGGGGDGDDDGEAATSTPPLPPSPPPPPPPPPAARAAAMCSSYFTHDAVITPASFRHMEQRVGGGGAAHAPTPRGQEAADKARHVACVLCGGGGSSVAGDAAFAEVALDVARHFADTARAEARMRQAHFAAAPLTAVLQDVDACVLWTSEAAAAAAAATDSGEAAFSNLAHLLDRTLLFGDISLCPYTVVAFAADGACGEAASLRWALTVAALKVVGRARLCLLRPGAGVGEGAALRAQAAALFGEACGAAVACALAEGLSLLPTGALAPHGVYVSGDAAADKGGEGPAVPAGLGADAEGLAVVAGACEAGSGRLLYFSPDGAEEGGEVEETAAEETAAAAADAAQQEGGEVGAGAGAAEEDAVASVAVDEWESSPGFLMLCRDGTVRRFALEDGGEEEVTPDTV